MCSLLQLLGWVELDVLQTLLAHRSPDLSLDPANGYALAGRHLNG